MSLEAYTGKISDLVDSNPTPTDPKSQGDDHLRGIKYTLKQTFPNFDGPTTQNPGQITPDTVQIGDGPAAENHFFDGSVPNQLSLKRGTPEAPGAELIKALNGVLSFPNQGQVLGSPGYVKLPGGVILQWGLGNLSAGVGTLVFPLEFPTQCFSVVLLPDTGTSIAMASDGVKSKSQWGIRSFNTGTGAAIASDFHWIAIGY